MSLFRSYKSWVLWVVATTKPVWRLLDANLNRLKEGVRVVEDMMRYLCDHQDLATRLKTIRHTATSIFVENKVDFNLLYTQRNSNADVLSAYDCMHAQSCLHMLQANFKRAQESARVLEECFKYILSPALDTPNFKTLRYELYTLEKECVLFFKQA